MPAAPPLVVNNAVQITLGFAVNASTTMVNVLAAIKTGTVVVDQTLANALGSSIKSAWTSNLAPRCPSITALNTVGVRDLSSPNLPLFVDAGASVAGTGTGDSLPGGNACVVSLKTALSGRRFRGRVYIGGFTETENLTSGTISTLVQSSAAAFVTAIDGALSSHTMRLAVLSRPAFATTITKTVTDSAGNSNVVTHNRPARAGAITQVQSISVRNGIWDSQRRRNGAGAGSTFMARPNVLQTLAP